MARESKQEKQRRAQQVIDRIDAHLPNADIELDYQTPLQLLVAVILSAQCTDKRVNAVTPALFLRYPDAAAYASASLPELESYIKTCGLFRSKAKNLIAAGKALCQDHAGRVPIRRAQLVALPGVGAKTAGVVSIHLDGDLAFPVDTHIKRLSLRLGFSRHSDPDKVEVDLRELLPEQRWKKGHQLLIWHGRRTCFARSPGCDRCVVAALCPKRGVAKRATGRSGPSLPPSRRARPSAASSVS